MAGKRKVRGAKEIIDMANQELNAAFSEFIKDKQADGLVKETIEAYKISYKKFCDCFDAGVDEDGNSYQGDKDDRRIELLTGNISSGLFREWKEVMREEELADATINHHLGCMRVFMYWCMADGRKYIEPFKITLVRTREKKPKDYTIAEVERLLKKPCDKGANKAKFTEWRTWAICNFVIGTGARLGTLVEIQIKDIDFKQRTVNYQHTKNRDVQVANISPKLVAVLREYINRCWQEPEQGDDYLFCNVSGEKLSKPSLSAGYRQYTKSRGVEKTNIHGLRHTFAREWYLNGGDLVQLSKILGHSSLAMSEHYMEIYQDMVKDRFDQYNPLDKITKAKRGKAARHV